MLRLPSGSKLGLGMKCMGSFLLPQVRSEAGPAAEEGKRIHALVEKYFTSGRSEEGLSDADAALCRRVDRSLGRPELSCSKFELGLLVDPGDRAAGRSASCNIVRASEPVPDELRSSSFYCIVDHLLYQEPSDGRAERASVWDFKTGATYVPDPEWNWQLLLPACGLWILAGQPDDLSVEAGILHVRADSIDPDDCYRAERHVYESHRLRASLEQLQKLASRGRQANPGTVTLYEGKHCQYCPARDRCPAKVGAIAQAMELCFNEEVAANDNDMVRMSMLLMDSKPMIDKAAKEILRNNGGTLDLGDGREAVLDVDKRGKEKVYTRRISASSKSFGTTEAVGVVGTKRDEEA